MNTPRWNPFGTVVFLLLEFIVTGFIHAGNESTLHTGYFDIESGSAPGTEVIGRINPESNRFAETNTRTENINFSVIGGTGADYFSIETQRDYFGHHFGVIKTKRKLPDKRTRYGLKVECVAGTRTVETIEIMINVSKSTHWQNYLNFVTKSFTRESRIWGRVELSEEQAERIIDHIIRNGGRLPGQDYEDPNQGWISICNTIGGLAHNLVLKNKYGPDGDEDARQELRKALYLAYINLHALIPVDEFSEYEEIEYSNRSHQWRYTDPLTGAAVFAYAGWLQDMESGDEELNLLAREAYDKLLHILEISWQAPSRNRAIPEDKIRYAGYWSDANRDHRMRTWMGLVALMHDYNRPITYEDHWYPYTSGKHEEFSLLPGWCPDGSFSDLQYWIQTNHRPSYAYWLNGRASGYHPDGSISHHTGHGNDMAMFAYGYEWLADKAISLAGWFNDTPWEIREPFWSTTARYFTYSISSMVYQGGHDMAFCGRSHNSPNLDNFGQKYFARDLRDFIEAIPEEIELPKRSELVELARSTANGTHQKSINVPFWNGDAMLHRRGAEESLPYYMSVKMLSNRTRGAEGFSPDRYSYHMGDGLFQVKVGGGEYTDARFDWDWHVLPGTTVEWRTDKLPMAKGTYDYPTGTNTYAGVTSNGSIGAASFIFDRSEDPYSTASARKSYFFFDKFAVMTGSAIQRVHPGQGNRIVTTIDQAGWSTDINFSINGAKPQSIQLSSDVQMEFNIDDITWFHQGQTGYIIWPNSKTDLTTAILRTGSAISDTDQDRAGNQELFFIALDHGNNPQLQSAGYCYAVVPNVKASQMAGIAVNLDKDLEILIDKSAYHAVHDRHHGITQISYFEPAKVLLDNDQTIRVDNPALVLIQEKKGTLQVALSDPDHRSDTSVINLFLTEILKPSFIRYSTMGVDHRSAEMVEVKSSPAGSVLTFQLPDKSDAELYQNRQQMFYGMPVVVEAEIAD